MDGGCVCLEFFKKKDGSDKVLEVFRVSADGKQVLSGFVQ